MSQDLRLYFLSLAIVLMLWVVPAGADYGSDSGCPTLAIPIQLSDGDIWHAGDEDEGNWVDYRDLYPVSGTSASVIDGFGDFSSCSLSAGSGTYYDGANHLWVLDDNLTCDFVYSGSSGDFRAGFDY